MKSWWILLFGVAAFPAADFLTGRLRRYALKRQIVDVPNARSSHEVPTPRGGGLSIAVMTVIGVLAAGLAGLLTARATLALAGGGTLMAALGFADDRKGLSAEIRFLAQVLIAGFLLYTAGGWPVLHLGIAAIRWDEFGWVAGIPAVVWMVNLYNFMDGIDGLAGSEAATVGSAGAVLFWSMGQPGLALVCVILVAASAGFLVWNWPPARIFMGDAGSLFIGYTMAALTLLSVAENPRSLWFWVLMLGVFEVDATLTLIRRFALGRKVSEAHRSHAYQHAAHRYGHRRVTMAVVLIDLFWLLPLALVTLVKPYWSLPLVVIGLLPLMLAAWRMGCGLDEPRRR